MDLEEPLRPVGEVTEGEEVSGSQAREVVEGGRLTDRNLPNVSQGRLAPSLVLVLVHPSVAVVSAGRGSLDLPHCRAQGDGGDFGWSVWWGKEAEAGCGQRPREKR